MRPRFTQIDSQPALANIHIVVVSAVLCAIIMMTETCEFVFRISRSHIEIFDCKYDSLMYNLILMCIMMCTNGRKLVT